MPGSLKNRTLQVVLIAIALLPWLITMYTFYWLDSSGTWTSETPHRGKLSVIILGAGMVLSFVLWTQLNRRNHK